MENPKEGIPKYADPDLGVGEAADRLHADIFDVALVYFSNLDAKGLIDGDPTEMAHMVGDFAVSVLGREGGCVA